MDAQFAGKHFVCGFCDGNCQAAVSEYQHRYPYRRVFKTMHPNLREAGLTYVYHPHVLAVGDAMCGVVRKCWISYTVTHKTALVRFLLQ